VYLWVAAWKEGLRLHGVVQGSSLGVKETFGRSEECLRYFWAL